MFDSDIKEMFGAPDFQTSKSSVSDFKKKSNRELKIIEEVKEKELEDFDVKEGEINEEDLKQASVKSNLDSENKLGEDFSENFDERSDKPNNDGIRSEKGFKHKPVTFDEDNEALRDISTKTNRDTVMPEIEEENDDINLASVKANLNSVMAVDDIFKEDLSVKFADKEKNKEVKSDNEIKEDKSENGDKGTDKKNQNHSDNEK